MRPTVLACLLSLGAIVVACSDDQQSTSSSGGSSSSSSSSSGGSTSSGSSSGHGGHDSGTADDGGTGSSSGDGGGDAGAAAACAAYCSCMAMNCSTTPPAGNGCVTDCLAQTTWDLPCRTMHCGYVPTMGAVPHCDHAGGVNTCQ